MYSIFMVAVVFACCAQEGVAAWHNKLLRGAKISNNELDSIGRAAAIRAEKATRRAARTGQCQCGAGKDYSAPCPRGWKVQNGGAECLAPPSYKGYCDTNQTFVLDDTSEKIEAEATCGVCWPCLDSCDRDWTAPCPQGYSPQNIPFDKFSATQFPECAADSAVKCQYLETFASIEQKQSFQEMGCGAWPCLTARVCKKYAECPKEWRLIGHDTCVAPHWYPKKEHCPPLMVFRHWTDSMRQQYADECSVSFCAEEDTFGNGGLALEDKPVADTSLCPVGWHSAPGGETFCHPPKELPGLCAKPRSFAGLTYEQKIRWASDCVNVRWPLKGEVAEPPSFSVEGGGAGPVNSDGLIISS